ncbi:plant U-box 38 [Artemisia annua]|uniref:RING-type E3 ubiquitin transferase n=1 Tax=Artemisia annua TaxID=35608 RepID=A0A2U1LXP2_ARTAN|nr:plant U-box 38 [Artemisia annua]
MVGTSTNTSTSKRRWRFSFHKPTPSTTKTTESAKTAKPLDEFICPISGQLMYDPVVVSSGETFERTSIEVCQDLGYVPVLAGGNKPDFTTVIPNLALKKAISNWCSLTGYDAPRYAPDYCTVEYSVKALMTSSHSGIRVSERDLLNGVSDKADAKLTHAVTELNPRSVPYGRFYSSSSEESVIANVPDTPPLPFVTRPLCYSSSPSASTSSEVVNEEGITDGDGNGNGGDELMFSSKLLSLDVYEQEQTVIMLRKVTRSDEEARVSLCTPRVLSSLRQCLVSRYAAVQTNAVAALVNLSLEKTNKLKIVRSGIVPPLIDVLKAGFAESQEHAAGAIFSLALEEENKTAIGVLGALQPLLHALHSESERTRHDSALALYHLSLVQSNRVKLVKLGACSTLLTMLETGLAGRVLLVLCNLAASNEGKSALLDSNAVECLFRKLRTESVDSNESTRENCVACLYSLSNGSMRFKGLARAARGMDVLRVVEEKGSERAREKAKRMLMMLRERDEGGESMDWDALIEGGVTQTRYRGNSTQF